MINSFTLCALILSGGARAQAAPDEKSGLENKTSILHVLKPRISPFVDMHYLIRARAASAAANAKGSDKPETTNAPRPLAPTPSEFPEMEAAIEVVRRIDAELGNALLWGVLDAPLSACESAAEALAESDKLPEEFTVAGGKRVKVRETVAELARVYATVEPRFLETIWPKHKQALREVRDRLVTELAPHESACFDFIRTSLRMKDPGLDIPVFLVAEAPPPGAVTHRSRVGGGICFVGIQDTGGSQLFEVVLHESIHALDIATSRGPSRGGPALRPSGASEGGVAGALPRDASAADKRVSTEAHGPERDQTVLEELRERLGAMGIGPTDKLYREVPHTLMFVQAGETVRRIIDPKHQHYGDAAGYYAKVPVATRATRGPWTEHLDGKIDESVALLHMIEEVRVYRSEPK